MVEILGPGPRDPNDDAPACENPVVDPGAPVIPVLIDLAVEQGQLVFKMKDDRNVPPDQSVIGHTDEDGYYIRVYAEIVVELKLSPWWDWDFDGDAPFTLKKKKEGTHDNSNNFHVRKRDAHNRRTVNVEIKPSGKPAGDHGFKQGFNLYVVMGQPNGGKLPVRIDPIVKNPPPIGGMNAPSGVFFPI
ncbi:MAG: nucleotide synthetase [Novosphingobium sp.]